MNKIMNAIDGQFMRLMIIFLTLFMLFSALSINVCALYIKTDIANHILYDMENRTYFIEIINDQPDKILVEIIPDIEIKEFLIIKQEHVLIEPHSSKKIYIHIVTSNYSNIGRYTGFIRVIGKETEKKIPLSIDITEKVITLLDLEIKPISEDMPRGGPYRFSIVLFNVAGTTKPVEVRLRYEIRDIETDLPLYTESDNLSVVKVTSFDKMLSIDNLSSGEYYLQVTAEYYDKTVKDSANFRVIKPFWTRDKLNAILVLVFGLVLLGLFLHARRLYFERKNARVRYVFPLDFASLPRKTATSFWLGRVAETKVQTFIDPKELNTHSIVAGATGSGKSVAASLLVEEALIKGIPVVIFDPTAQWTGMVRPCKDKNILDRYKDFGLDPDRDPKQFRGFILKMVDPSVRIDIKKYINPGEVTIFDLSGLYQNEYDLAVRRIIDSIFMQSWEEYAGLRLLIVFDEVHRLLEKYGGGGGYTSLERACREFRKWGIGLVMVSQITSDFKEAVAGNILTEIQMNTKAIEDISRIGKKYGEEYSKRVTREKVGTGMLQNPKYNDGKPYFVEFRPPFHSPHKLLDDELKAYVDYAHILESMEQKIKALKAEGKDVSEFELELKLSWNKLKEGRFRMVKIYIESLEDKLT